MGSCQNSPPGPLLLDIPIFVGTFFPHQDIKNNPTNTLVKSLAGLQVCLCYLSSSSKARMNLRPLNAVSSIYNRVRILHAQS